MDPRKVGRDLNVSSILNGTMNQQGDELTISAELVSVEDGYQIWGEQYNRKLTDLLELQKEI